MSERFEDLQVTYPGAGTFRLGHDAKSCKRLTALVRSGNKHATCEAAREFADEPEAMPVAGRHDIVANWDGSLALVIRTERVDEIRFCDVTEEMALAEGEDSDLESWRAWRQRHFEANGGFDPEMPLIFEHFSLVEDLSTR